MRREQHLQTAASASVLMGSDTCNNPVVYNVYRQYNMPQELLSPGANVHEMLS